MHKNIFIVKLKNYDLKAIKAATFVCVQPSTRYNGIE